MSPDPSISLAEASERVLKFSQINRLRAKKFGDMARDNKDTLEKSKGRNGGLDFRDRMKVNRSPDTSLV